MKLTPLDIRKHEFTRKVRGYDPEEVKAFTEMVSRQWEEVLDELRHSKDRVRELEGKIEHYEKVENALHEALESARSGAKRTQEQAEERARLIIEEAELKAEQRLQEVDQRQNKLRSDVTDLARRRDEIVARLRHFLMSELEILARHDEDRPIGFMQLMPSSPAENLPPAPEAKKAEARPSVTEPKEADEPVEAEASQEQPEPAPSDEEPEPQRGTTYGDLYARAAESESEREVEREARAAEVARKDEEDEAEDDEPTWTLRSIVSGHDDEPEGEAGPEPDAEPEPTAPDAEKERIRRILEDLD
jgi:cell division initiation protein